MTSFNGPPGLLPSLHSISTNLAPETMDHVLKGRKTSLSSARVKKFQERRAQSVLDKEKFQAYKSRIMMYDHMAGNIDDQEGNSAEDMELDSKLFDLESSVETPSEPSVLTPDDMHSNRAIFGKQSQAESIPVPPLKIDIREGEEILQMEPDENRVVVSPLSRSVVTLPDFGYDRFSCNLNSPPLAIPNRDFDADETVSLVGTATHLTFQQPKSRPSLISIANVSPLGKRRSPPMQSPLLQTVSPLPERPTKCQSTGSSHSRFPAAEAVLFPTSMRASSTAGGSGNTNITALPSLHTSPVGGNVTDPPNGRPNIQREKSFFTLRRRSESIGQAIKGLSKITGKRDVPIPTTKFSTPSLPSHRTGKSDARSYTSSLTGIGGENIGLGLRGVEGLSQR